MVAGDKDDDKLLPGFNLTKDQLFFISYAQVSIIIYK